MLARVHCANLNCDQTLDVEVEFADSSVFDFYCSDRCLAEKCQADAEAAAGDDGNYDDITDAEDWRAWGKYQER